MITPLELIGSVGAATLRDMMRDVSESDDVAMFKLDCLTGDQAAAIVRTILADAKLAAHDL